MCLAKKFTVAGQTILCAVDNVHNAVALWKQTTVTVNESYKGHNNLDLVTEASPLMQTRLMEL